MNQVPVRLARRLVLVFVAPVLVQAASCGCSKTQDPVIIPVNHSPAIDSLVAFPDTIRPSDSTVVTCYARDPDGELIVYDWETDARLRIQGNPPWDRHLNQQLSPSHTFYNANLSNPINDSAWVFCGARDLRGGGTGGRVWVLLRPATSGR